MVTSLTSDDHVRIAAAIAQAETTTSGEIFCVVARRGASHLDVSLGWAAAAALLLPLIMIPLGFDPAWLPGLGDSWESAQLAARDVTVGRALAAYAVVQVVLFACVFLISRLPPVLRLATPPSVRRSRVRRAALRQFLAHGLQASRDRTGLLIFVDIQDRRVEIVADEGIHGRVGEEVWIGAVDILTAALRRDRLAEGVEQAVAATGVVLAEHFPPRADNPDELPNRIVEI